MFHLTSLSNNSSEYMELFKILHSKLVSINVPLGLQSLDNNSKRICMSVCCKFYLLSSKSNQNALFRLEMHTFLETVTTWWQEVLLKSHQK